MAPSIQSCAWTPGGCGTSFASITPIRRGSGRHLAAERQLRADLRSSAARPPSRYQFQAVEPTSLDSHSATTPDIGAPTSARSKRGLAWRGARVGNGGGVRRRVRALSPNIPRSTTPPGRIMLAVLPFQNLTGDPEQEYLCDGLTEEMIAMLGGVDSSRLGVIARTSAMHYKNTTKRADEIGRELGVGYLLETSLRRIGDRVRITAQLIDVRDTRSCLGGTVRARRAGRPRAAAGSRRRDRAAHDGEPWDAGEELPLASDVSRTIHWPTSTISEVASNGPRTR